MKQQYCDNDLITFNLQGLLWVAKENVAPWGNQPETYHLKLQYRTQSIDVEFPDEKIRDSAYEKTRLLLVPLKKEE